MNHNIELISLIYKSTTYLNLIVSEFSKLYCTADGWNVGVRVVANDADTSILNVLPNLNIPYSIYNDPTPEDYYLNRIYRCWNYAGKTSTYDNICFVNSDMIFSDGWLSSLLKHHNGINIPCSRLIESGKLLSGANAIGNMNFGRKADDVRYEEWYSFANKTKSNRVVNGGLFMPCVFEKERFIQSGMYPEGNIYQDGKAGSMTGNVIDSGDAWYFKSLESRFGMKHITVFDSLVYHIQEGEMDE